MAINGALGDLVCHHDPESGREVIVSIPNPKHNRISRK